jgi:hypothetical protein
MKKICDFQLKSVKGYDIIEASSVLPAGKREEALLFAESRKKFGKKAKNKLKFPKKHVIIK